MPIRTKLDSVSDKAQEPEAAREDTAPVDPEVSAVRLLAGLMRGEVTFGSVLGFEAADLQRMLDIGEAQLNMGRPERARRIFEGMTALEPDVAALYLPLGMACEACGDLDEAFVAYTEAIHMMVEEVDPTLCGAYLGRGQVRYRQGDLAGALTDIALAREYDEGVDADLLDTIETMATRWAERYSAERES